jgi:hypothetical protein
MALPKNDISFPVVFAYENLEVIDVTPGPDDQSLSVNMILKPEVAVVDVTLKFTSVQEAFDKWCEEINEETVQNTGSNEGRNDLLPNGQGEEIEESDQEIQQPAEEEESD